MITGEIAILFASAAGIGAAAATWVYDRRLTKRLTDLRRDVDYLKDRVRDVDYLKDRVRENRERLDKTATAIAALQRVANRRICTPRLPTTTGQTSPKLRRSVSRTGSGPRASRPTSPRRTKASLTRRGWRQSPSIRSTRRPDCRTNRLRPCGRTHRRRTGIARIAPTGVTSRNGG